MADAHVLSIEARLQMAERNIKTHDKVLNGNGREGLVETVAKIRGTVESIEKSATLLATTAREMQSHQSKFMTRTTKEVSELGASATNARQAAERAHKRLKAVEEDLRNITDFKKSLVTRASTIVGIYGFLATVVGLVVYHREVLAEFLTK